MIDVHAHVVLEGTLGCAGHYGPELGQDASGAPWFRVGDYVLHGVRYRESPFMDVDRRLALNDHLGIDVQMLSPNPLTYFHHVEVEVAAKYCRWHNDEMAKVVAAHPDRFLGAAQLPMQDVAAAVDELRRAVTDVGLVAAYIGTDFGVTFDAPALDLLWAAAVELDVPIFVHPAPSGIDGPRRDERLRRYDLELSLGFLYEETLAVAGLLFGGVLDRHPGTGHLPVPRGRCRVVHGRAPPPRRPDPAVGSRAPRRRARWAPTPLVRPARARHGWPSSCWRPGWAGIVWCSAPTWPAGMLPRSPSSSTLAPDYDVNARRLLRLPTRSSGHRGTGVSEPSS
jgi:hypothetical protein